MPKHEVEEIARPDGSVRYFGRCRVGPYKLVWREQPVNWVHGQVFEHCRYFENGPLKSLCAQLDLIPTDAGCEGRYRITAEPAGLVGELLRNHKPVEQSAELKGFAEPVAFFRLSSPVPPRPRLRRSRRSNG